MICDMEWDSAESDEMMEDSVHPVAPPQGWRYPKFESLASTIDRPVSIDRSTMYPGNETIVLD